MKTLSAQEFIKEKGEQFAEEYDRGETRKMKDIGRKGHHHYLRTHWTFMKQHNNAQKVFTVERMELAKVTGKTESMTEKDIGHIEYRISYWIVGRIGRKRGIWTWGQYCPMIPERDLSRLLAKAKKEGTIK